MIIGTAGHIDHGKTALVRALTGVDTDRLPEEKKRGITIDLGFAPLVLDGIGQVGVVDVPGHEAFVRTMVAGAAGIDVALIVVAADAGVMPQTREHLAILDLLGVSEGVVALTKTDLVDNEWRSLAEEDVRETLARSSLRSATIVPVSAINGEGLSDLRAALSAALSRVRERPREGLFRLPVDRVFTVKGTGTVVTGTVWSGSLGRDDNARLMPAERTVRVRGLQAHGKAVEAVQAGDRAAVALAGVELDDVHRGMVIVQGAGWRANRVLRADVQLTSPMSTIIGPRRWVRFHLGTQEVGARIVTRGSPETGAAFPARVVLDAPVVARAGDRFVLRTASPAETIGGGIVTDPQAPARARPFAAAGLSKHELLAILLDEAGAAGLTAEVLEIRCGASGGEFDAAVSAIKPWPVANRLIGDAHRGRMHVRIIEELTSYHRDHAAEPAAPMQWLRSRLDAPEEVASAAIAEMNRDGRIRVENAGVALAAFSASLSAGQERLRASVLSAVSAAGAEPPSIDELAASLKVLPGAVGDVLRWLAREGRVVPVEPGRYYSTEAVLALRARLESGMPESREYAPAELRDVLGLTRKFLIPFLEYCDREGYTIRGGLGRRLAGSSAAPSSGARVR